MFRRFMMWLGYIPTWFDMRDFERVVGHAPCARCVAANESYVALVLCERDLDDWFDAVLA